MLTLVLVFFPLVAAIPVLLSGGRYARTVAAGAAFIELIVAAALVFRFGDGIAGDQFSFATPWVSSLGLSLSVGIDGITLPLVILTTVLVPFIILSSPARSEVRPASFFALILVMQFALVGVFVARDGLLFYLFWEVALIPVYFICLFWGGPDRSRITFKFFVYTLAGSLLMLVALIYLYHHTAGARSFAYEALYDAGRSLTSVEQQWIFWALFIAFAIKMPVFPFHTWQPDTYTDAPVEGTMLLSGIMLKMGLYGVIRLLLPVVPAGVEEWGTTAAVLSVTGIVYASCLAMMQRDYKRLIAYSSIAHVGLISAGIFTLSETGVQGAVIQMVSHGIIAFGLFYCVDVISVRAKTRDLGELGGIRSMAPVFTTALIVLMLGSVALPLTSGFVGEFLLLTSLFEYSRVLGALGGLTIILGAVYMLRAFQQSMTGDAYAATPAFKDLSSGERLVIFPMVILVIVIGVYPTPLLELSAASVHKILDVYYAAGVAVK